MTEESQTVLNPKKFGGGPLGLGDPNDRSLRRVELEIMIPKLMREVARTIKCAEEASNFESCGKRHGLMMFMNCRNENNKLKECLTNWYQNEKFKEECTEVYLNERKKFRETGTVQKIKRLH